MGRRALAATFLVLLASGAAAIDFTVDVAADSEAALFDTNHSTSGDVHRFNATLENPSSVGCVYRLRGEFERGGETERRYSTAYPMWPGNASSVEIRYAPVNYTGQVDADIDMFYCDTARNLSDYSFEVSNPGFNDSYEAETLEAGEESVRFRIEKEKTGELVPVRKPAFWRVGSSRIVNGTAKVSYDAPIFRPKNITFAVVENGSIDGKVEVRLEETRVTLMERIQRNSEKILRWALVASLAINLALLAAIKAPDEYVERIKEGSDRSLRN